MYNDDEGFCGGLVGSPVTLPLLGHGFDSHPRLCVCGCTSHVCMHSFGGLQFPQQHKNTCCHIDWNLYISPDLCVM